MRTLKALMIGLLASAAWADGKTPKSRFDLFQNQVLQLAEAHDVETPTIRLEKGDQGRCPWGIASTKRVDGKVVIRVCAAYLGFVSEEVIEHLAHHEFCHYHLGHLDLIEQDLAQRGRELELQAEVCVYEKAGLAKYRQFKSSYRRLTMAAKRQPGVEISFTPLFALMVEASMAK